MGLEKRGEIWYFTKRINGQRFRESTGFADKKSAERRAVEIEHDIRAGVHGWKSTIPSFAEWWAVYRETYTPLKSARNRDAQIVAHFLPHFGAKRLDEITKSEVVRYLNLRRTQMTGNPGHKKRRLVSESTVRRERGLLQSIFERAIDDGHDFRNPFRGMKCRTDWTRGTVHVIGKGRKERDVPMQPDAHSALVEQLEEEGKLWRQNPQRLREVLADGAARAKVPPEPPRVLRHTFGTRWLQAGGDIYKLSKILGHSSVAVTEAHYAHLLKEDLIAASRQVKLPIGKRTTDNVVPMRTRHRGQDRRTR